jgi:hypothetical protein
MQRPERSRFGSNGIRPSSATRDGDVPFLILPYWGLEKLLPIVTLSGVPVRMIVMVILVGSLFVAEGLRLCLESGRRGHVALACAVAVVIGLEHLPGNLPATRVPVPEVVNFLRDHPGNEGYFDATGGPFLGTGWHDRMAYRMFYQTIHQMPIADGYTARTTTESIEHDRELERLVSVGDLLTLRCRYRFKWLLSERVIDQTGVLLRRQWSDPPSYLYELAENCAGGSR